MTAPSLRTSDGARGMTVSASSREIPAATLLTTLALLLCALAAPATAQQTDELDEGIEATDPLDEGVAMEVPFEPGIESNVWEISAQFGYHNVDQVLWSHLGVIVDIESPDELLFADTELTGEQSFSPQLRISRTFGKHFSFDASFGSVFGDFSQTIDRDNQERWQDPNGDNELTENESEKGSFFGFIQDVGLTYYPRGEGRMQPYLTGGIGSQWYDVDSDYIDGFGKGLSFSYGGGLRVVMDDLYSFRFEVRNYHTEIGFDVNPEWRLDQNIQGTALIGIPVLAITDYRDSNGVPRFSADELNQIYGRLGLPVPTDLDNLVSVPVLVEEYESQSFSNLYISAGFVASF